MSFSTLETRPVPAGKIRCKRRDKREKTWNGLSFSVFLCYKVANFKSPQSLPIKTIFIAALSFINA